MKALLALLIVAAGCTPEAPPATHPKAVLLVRHAEKPTDGEDVHLSPAGKRRAEALPDVFKKSPSRPVPFPTPDVILATKASRHSNRPVETVTPLARALKLPVNSTVADDDYPRLARELVTNPAYAGKTVLVCWHHGTLPKLAEALGTTGVPGKWKDAVFDRVWVVAFDETGKAGPLVSRPQSLMPGDATE